MTWNIRIAAITTILISLAGSAWFGYSKGRQSGMQEVQTLWTTEKLAIADAINQELIRTRAREKTLQDLANRLRREKRNELDQMAANYAADLERMRNRTDVRAGPGGVPTGASPGVGCTGAGLARPDAQFLVWFAAESAKLRAAYDECKVKYEAVTKEQ